MSLDSKLVSYRLHNFASFDDATITIPEDTGILKINGYNNVGKSAILRSMSMLFLGKYEKSQEKFVRDGHDYFELEATFSDGVTLYMRRYSKDAGSGVYYEFRKDGKVAYTTKEGNALTAVRGIPEPFERYLGLVRTKKADLNYRDRNDDLLFTTTKARDNNDTLNDILKFVEISEASLQLNKDINSLNSDYNTVWGSFEAFDSELSNLPVVTEEQLTEIDSIYIDTQKVVKQYHSLDSIDETLPRIDEGAITRKANLSELESDASRTANRYSALKEIQRVFGSAKQTEQDIKRYADLAELPTNFSSRSMALNKMQTLEELLTSLNSTYLPYEDLKELSNQLATRNIPSRYGMLERMVSCIDALVNTSSNGGVEKLEDLRKVDEQSSLVSSQLASLQPIFEAYNVYLHSVKDEFAVADRLTALRKERDARNEELRSAGIQLEKCPNCGEYFAAV